MIAVRKLEPGPGLELTTLNIPEIGKNDVLIKVRACSICGSDVHIYDWDSPFSERIKPPRTIGHEIAGDVVEIGKNVTSVQVGDYVSAESHIACGKCPQCRNGRPHICDNMKILGIDVDGGFAEYVSIPERNAWKNPKDIPPYLMFYAIKQLMKNFKKECMLYINSENRALYPLTEKH
jgi:threonine 3-dehydrogenase